MRLIDADALPSLFDEKFKETMRLIKKGESHLDNLAEGFTEAHQVIFMQPTIEAEPKWIPVTERLPKQNEHIIGTFKNINEGSNLVFGVNFYHDLLNEPMPLIAWMPLPPAYQGE